MRKIFRIAAVAIFTIFIFGALEASEAKAQILNEIYNRMEKYNAKLQTVQASVTMDKHDSWLRVSDKTTGTLKYLPKRANGKMYARIDWSTPTVEHIAVIGDEYTLYRPKLSQVYIGKTDQTKNKVPSGTLSFMNMSKAQLKTNYTVKYLGEETVAGGVSAWHLELTPKKQEKYKIAHLWVNKDGFPVMTKLVEKNDDWTTILLSNLKINETLNANIFVIDYPKSIKPIQG